MASRTHKLGSIYARINGLIKTGVMKNEDIPIWHEIYKRFPPRRDPVFRSVATGDKLDPEKPMKILYYEDVIRSKYYQEFDDKEVHDFNDHSDSTCNKFIKTFYQLQNEGISAKNLFEACTEKMKEQGFELQSRK